MQFGVFVDMRTLEPLPFEAQGVMVKGQKFYMRAGMVRSVVILKDSITTRQFQNLARESGIHQGERCIDACTTPDWEQIGLRWVVDGIEPESRDAGG